MVKTVPGLGGVGVVMWGGILMRVTSIVIGQYLVLGKLNWPLR